MISFLWEVIKPYRYYYLMMALAPLGSGIYPILYNYAVKLVIDLFTIETSITVHQALVPIAVFIGAQMIVDIGWRLHNFAQLKAIPYVFQNMMEKICQHVFYLPYAYFQDNFSGSISGKMRDIGNNYYKMHQAIEFQLSRPALITLFSGVALAFVNLQVFLFVAAFVSLYTPLALKFFKKLSLLEKAKQDSWYHLSGKISDNIQNIFTIFSFASRQKEVKKIRDYYKTVQNPLAIAYFRYDFIISIVLSLVYWIFLISVFVFVIYLKNRQEISVGDIAFIISLSFLFSENSWQTTIEMKDFLKDLATFKSGFSILEVPRCSIDEDADSIAEISKGEIVFQNMGFYYDEHHKIFEHFNLHILPGQKIGLVGQSGAGKSTLIALLLKHFRVKTGKIIIDNQSIYSISSDNLRSQISLIPQDVMLFHRTIGENIGYAKENAAQEEIQKAATIANIHDFITSLPDGYDTLVGERGIKLSGGQRQRIAIARAVLKHAKILILDEATSSLDSETENEIQSAIQNILKDKEITVIAIAHRLSTIKNMDRIIVMEHGQIVEDGSFEELLSSPNKKFKDLWNQQYRYNYKKTRD